MGVTMASGWVLRMALRMASNRVVRLLLTPGSSGWLMSSTETRGSLMRAFISEMNSAALTPGSRRQSRVASLVDGITLTLGGEPPPAVSVVSEMVLAWSASVYLLRARGSPRLRTISATMGWGLAGGWAKAFSSACSKVTLALSAMGWEPWAAVP